ncbi:MAG: translation elongation factor Ts [Planctomycetota bacterium]
MTQISASTVASLRGKTGAGLMDCKRALSEAKGDEQLAIDILRRKGIQAAAKKAGRSTSEGRVFAYIHHNSRVGVLIEVACETDFVARGEVFEQLLKDLSMHIAAMVPTPLAVSKEGVPPGLVEEEKRILLESEDMQGKPEEIRKKIVQGRLEKFIAERALLEQEFVKDPSKTVGGVLKEAITRLGENIRVNRFVRFELGA